MSRGDEMQKMIFFVLGLCFFGSVLHAETTYVTEFHDWSWTSHSEDKTKAASFEELGLSEKEEKTLEQMLHMLASSSDAKVLILQQKKLDKYFQTLNPVHPLKVLSYIIQHPILRSDLQEVHRSFFKWRKFLEFFRRRMTEEFYKDNLKNYTPGFCDTLHVKKDVVDHFISHRDWEGLIKAVLY